MKISSRCFLLLCCFLFLGANKSGEFKFIGINQPEILINAQQRLLDVINKNPSAQTKTEQLRIEVENAVSPYGYFQPQVSINLQSKVIVVELGKPLKISELQIKVIGEGCNKFEIKHAIKKLPLKKNEILNTNEYEKAKSVLLKTAENLGYIKAFFEESQIIIDKQQYTSKMILTFNTGPQYYFGQILFAPTNISPALLHRYAPFQYGQSYSADKILEFNNNLLSSGYFQQVNVNPSIKNTSDVPINLSLKAVKHYSYTLGAGYGTDTGPRGVASFKVVPVNRRGHKLNLFLKGSFTENTFQTQYVIPGNNPVNDQYSIGGGLSTFNYSNSYSNSLLFSFAQQHTLKNFQRFLSINELLERYNYFTEKTQSHSLLYPKAVITWSKVTDELFSPSGYNITILGLAASKFLLSEINLAQGQIDGKVALMVEPIKTRLYFHGIQGITAINNPDQIPVSLSQLLGGTTNLKGYSYNSIGPGKLQTYAGIEVQKKIYKNWFLVGLFDMGNVYKPYNTPTKYDVGVGLMWASPFGLIKVGAAQPITHSFNRIPNSSPRLFINAGTDL